MNDATDTLLFIHSITSGGAERMCLNLATSLNAEMIPCSVVVFSKADFYDVPDFINIIRLERRIDSQIPYILSGLRNLLLVIRCIKVIRSIKPKNIIVFTAETSLIVLTSCILSGFNGKVICSERNSLERPVSSKIRFCQRVLYRIADHLVCPSESVEIELNNKFNHTNTLTIHNYTKLPAINYPFENRRNIILCVGRLVKQKSPEILLESFKEISTQFPEWSLIFLGDGPLRNTLEANIKLYDLEERVVIMGTVHDVDALYSQAKILVLPSRYEGFPNVLLESWKYCLAVIISDKVSTGLVVDNIDSLVFNWPSSHDLSQKLIKLLGNADLITRLGISGNKKLAKFSEANAITSWKRLLSS